ncbi:MAG: hypothetical protein QXF97_06540 [Candidatus Caldarchaeum sp.]
MKVEELLKIKQEIWRKCDELTVSKGQGYGKDDDTLFNTRLCEILGILPAEEGVYIRLLDKVVRLGRQLKNPQIPHEGVEDTVVDAINYLTYIYAILLEKRESRV